MKKSKTYYRVAEAADQLGISASTLRKWTNEGKVKETRNISGQRVYTQQEIDRVAGKTPTIAGVYYVRSSDGDNVKLHNQIQALTTEYGEPLKIYQDKASGLNEKRPGLNRMLKDAKNKQFNTIYITQKDRLTRFGFEYLSELFAQYDVKIVIQAEKNEQTLQEELIQDLMSLIASFSGKYYRIRGYEQRKQLLNTLEARLHEQEQTHL